MNKNKTLEEAFSTPTLSSSPQWITQKNVFSSNIIKRRELGISGFVVGILYTVFKFCYLEFQMASFGEFLTSEFSIMV